MNGNGVWKSIATRLFTKCAGARANRTAPTTAGVSRLKSRRPMKYTSTTSTIPPTAIGNRIAPSVNPNALTLRAVAYISIG